MCAKLKAIDARKGVAYFIDSNYRTAEEANGLELLYCMWHYTEQLGRRLDDANCWLSKENELLYPGEALVKRGVVSGGLQHY